MADESSFSDTHHQHGFAAAGALTDLLGDVLRNSVCELCEAIDGGDEARVRSLLASGAAVPPCSPFMAIECCEPAILRALLEFDPVTVLLRARDPRGFTSLHACCDEEAEDCMEVILETLERLRDGDLLLLTSRRDPVSGAGQEEIAASVSALLNARMHKCACSGLDPHRSTVIRRWHYLAVEAVQAGRGYEDDDEDGALVAACDACACACHPRSQQRSLSSNHGRNGMILGGGGGGNPRGGVAAAPSYVLARNGKAAPVFVTSVHPWCPSGPGSSATAALFSAWRRKKSEGYSETSARFEARRAAQQSEERTQQWRSPLHLALQRRNNALVRMLILAGADPHLPHQGSRRSPAEEAPESMRRHLARCIEEAQDEREMLAEAEAEAQGAGGKGAGAVALASSSSAAYSLPRAHR